MNAGQTGYWDPRNRHRWPGAEERIAGERWNDLFVWGHRRQMSDMHVQTYAPVKIVVHGRFYDVTPRPVAPEEVRSALMLLYGPTAEALLKKGEAFNKAHTVADRTGTRFLIGAEDRSALDEPQESYRFRVNGVSVLTNGIDGAQVTLRRIEDVPPTLESLRLEPGILAHYRPQNGIVLVCGATGTGKTRTLAGMTRAMIEDPEFHGKVIEIAFPIEYLFDRVKGTSALYSVSEIPGNVKTALDGMIEALRRAPRAILSPECRSAEDMAVALMASQTGHAVLSTVHTSKLVETVQRVLFMFHESEREDRAIALMHALRLIVNCTLVPSTAEGGGRGQLREFLPFDPEGRERMLDAPISSWPRLTRDMLRERGQTFAQAAQAALERGEITGETARRVREKF